MAALRAGAPHIFVLACVNGAGKSSVAGSIIRSGGLNYFNPDRLVVGLATPEHHIARVRARVGAGGHDIPEEMIRKRWESSRQNIINLMPHLAELKVFDNTQEVDPATDTLPQPRLLLHVEHGKIIERDPNPPEWAKPILAAALPK